MGSPVCRNSPLPRKYQTINLPPVGAFSTRFVAAELRDTNRPSALMEGAWLSSFAGVPSAAAERRVVWGWQPAAALSQVIPQKDLGAIFCTAV